MKSPREIGFFVGDRACYASRVEDIGGKKLIRWNGYSGVAAALVAVLALAGADGAQATVYTLSSPDATVFGEDQTVETVYEDTLYDLARRNRRQSSRAPALLLSEAEAGRPDRGHHLPGQHRQDGLAHAARNHPRDW